MIAVSDFSELFSALTCSGATKVPVILSAIERSNSRAWAKATDKPKRGDKNIGRQKNRGELYAERILV